MKWTNGRMRYFSALSPTTCSFPRPQTPYPDEWDCFREDDVNLVQQWKDEHDNSMVVRRREELNEVNVDEVDYLWGLFGSDHVPYDDQRVEERDPPLYEMVEKGIEMLKKNGNGFFLMVESGRIDHAHHDVQAKRALRETISLDRSVEAAMEVLKDELDETLLIVTADHSHTMSMSGYPDRNTDIESKAKLRKEPYDVL